MSKVPNEDAVFMQLEGALILLARAKGEQPARSYLEAMDGSNSRLLKLDGGEYVVAIVQLPPEEK